MIDGFSNSIKAALTVDVEDVPGLSSSKLTGGVLQHHNLETASPSRQLVAVFSISPLRLLSDPSIRLADK